MVWIAPNSTCTTPNLRKFLCAIAGRSRPGRTGDSPHPPVRLHRSNGLKVTEMRNAA